MAVLNYNVAIKTQRLAIVNAAIGANAILQFYTGSPPFDPSVAINTANQILLATLIGNISGFGSVTAGVSGISNPYITGNPVSASYGFVDGIPGFMRVSSFSGVAIIDLDVGGPGSSASVILNPYAISYGAPVNIVSITIKEN